MKKNSIPEKLRICFVSQKFPRFGNSSDYSYLWPLCQSLARQGHDISVITAENRENAVQETVDGVRIYHIESSILGDSAIKESVVDVLENLHEEKPFDLIHSVDNTGLNIALHKKQLNVALAVDVKGSSLDEIFGLLGLTEDTVVSYLKTSFGVATKFLHSFFGADHKLLKKADGIFVTSKQQQDILESYYLIASRKVHVIPYGIDGAQFEPDRRTPELFKNLGISHEAKVILTISPLTNIEEIKNLLTAFERVVIKKPNSVLIVVGNGPKLKELEFHMLTLALASHVYFLGEVPASQINSFINSCDVYVNLYSKSSDFEPTVLEAMACGKMVVASEVGTSSGLISSGVDGFLLRPTEITSLSRLLLEAVSGQIDIQGIGMRARQKILKMFDTARIVDQTVKAYREILKATGKYKK